MKINKIMPLLLLATVFFSACKKDEQDEIDTTYPEISIAAPDAFPKQCSVIKRGEKFIFRAVLSDNVELGSVSVDIHHNFDHHTHSTEVTSCEMEPVKVAVNPFLLIQAYQIPTGQKTFTVQQELTVPANVDTGDYHFMIRLTDKEGWQTIRGISVKIQ
ncbi:DUF4625 domain-containing protein [Pedobacter sp. AW31-3R]|uniref:DUF4625 domain-containing protein n=1 Tax=Pedobacter sp. AW31-3R TaxID=3445781 RepID=UPI003FA11B6C